MTPLRKFWALAKVRPLDSQEPGRNAEASGPPGTSRPPANLQPLQILGFQEPARSLRPGPPGTLGSQEALAELLGFYKRWDSGSGLKEHLGSQPPGNSCQPYVSRNLTGILRRGFPGTSGSQEHFFGILDSRNPVGMPLNLLGLGKILGSRQPSGSSKFWVSRNLPGSLRLGLLGTLGSQEPLVEILGS